jgi:polysaccharide biosynthesis transport protein
MATSSSSGSGCFNDPAEELFVMSFIQFLRILAARRAIVLAALLSCFLTALVTSQILPERFKAQVRLVLDVVKPDPVTGELLANGFVRAYTATQIALIRDYKVAGRVVDQLGWPTEPGLVASYADATNGQGRDIRRWLAQRIIDQTQAKLLEGSNILEITFTGSTPDDARRIADLLRDAYLESSLEYKKTAATRSADWFRDQTDKTQALLLTAETQRSKFAKDKGIVLQADNTDLESAKLAMLSGQSAAAIAGSAPPMMSAPAAMGAAAMQLEVVNQQIAQAATTLGPNHPAFQALERQRTILAGAAQREGRGGVVISGGGGAGQVEAAYRNQKARVLAQREDIDRIGQMTRDIEVKRDQYLKSAQRAAEFRQQAEVGETGVTPLGDAVAPESPSFPNMPLILFGSIGFGLALGIVAALLVEMLARRVRSDDDLEYAADAPVFAIIGQADDARAWYRRLARWISRSRAARTARLADA